MKKLLLFAMIVLLQNVTYAQIDSKKIVADCKFYGSFKTEYPKEFQYVELDPYYQIQTIPYIPKPYKNYSYLVSPSIGIQLNNRLVLGVNYEFGVVKEGFSQRLFRYEINTYPLTIENVYLYTKHNSTGIFLKYQQPIYKRLLIGINGYTSFTRIGIAPFNDNEVLYLSLIKTANYLQACFEPEFQVMVSSNVGIKFNYILFLYNQSLNKDKNSNRNFSIIPNNMRLGISYFFNVKSDKVE